jgi:hypothetical protein
MVMPTQPVLDIMRRRLIPLRPVRQLVVAERVPWV